MSLLGSLGQWVLSGHCLPCPCAPMSSPKPWQYGTRGQDAPPIPQLPALHLRNKLLYQRLQQPCSCFLRKHRPPTPHTQPASVMDCLFPCVGAPQPHFLCWPQDGAGRVLRLWAQIPPSTPTPWLLLPASSPAPSLGKGPSALVTGIGVRCVCGKLLTPLPLPPPQFQDLKWTCWVRLKVPAEQPERTLKSLLAYLQVSPVPPDPQAWPNLAQLSPDRSLSRNNMG